jgi:hypothetical protein
MGHTIPPPPPATAAAAAPNCWPATGILPEMTFLTHFAHSVWKQLSRHGSVYDCPQLWRGWGFTKIY